MKAMGHADVKTTMIYADVGKPHIREQVEKLDRIVVPRPQSKMKALAALTSPPWSVHPHLRVRIPGVSIELQVIRSPLATPPIQGVSRVNRLRGYLVPDTEKGGCLHGVCGPCKLPLL